MRIAFVGKGGSGKTTLASLLVKLLKAQRVPVLAIDADINQHLGEALGYPQEMVDAIPDIGNHLLPLKTMLRGNNPRIVSPDIMVKTTLPGDGSHLIRMTSADPVLGYFALRDGSQSYFIRVGGFTNDDLGIRCYHAKTGGAELILNHLMDSPTEAIVMDMTAGADAFASGLFTRFDLTVVVVEPTLKSLSVYQQYKSYAQGFDVRLKVVGNKVETSEDEAFLQQQCGEDLLGFFRHSAWVKAAERGHPQPLDTLESANRDVLQAVWQEAQAHPRNWQKYWEQGVFFHNKNALSWANESVGTDVREQVDLGFLLKISH